MKTQLSHFKYAAIAVALSSSIFVSGFSHAGDGCYYRSCDGRIEGLFWHGNGDVLIDMEVGNVDALDCNPEEGKWIRLKTNHPNYANISASLLAAFNAGKRVRVRPNSNGNCQVVYVISLK